MNFMRHAGTRICGWTGMRPGALLLIALIFPVLVAGQALSTTSVQGTVYRANGQTGAGTLIVSWPAFTTAAGQAVAAGRTTLTIGSDGFVNVNLAPNQGATPAGLFYTAIYHLNDGTTSTEYWMVPAAAQATLADVRTQVMPAAQAVQAVNKSYVDQSISELTQSLLTSSGGNLNGALYLNGDPTQPAQAADKHYVDSMFGQSLPLAGGAASGPITATQLGAAYQVDQMHGADFGAKLQTCINTLNSTYGGTCDARNFSGTLAMASSVTVAKSNVTILLPCATIATANQFIVTAGTRNVSVRGCSLRGGSAASGNQGGTVLQYSGAAAMIQVGDPTYAVDTPGFHMDNAVLSTTAASSATAQGLVAYRTQELDLESLYFLGNANQTGITLDGTGNYTGGTFFDDTFNGFLTAVNAIGHQVANSATTDWVNASTFVRLHVNCPTSSSNPISGTTGINLVAGDGNTFTGGDVEGCATALHLGASAQNNTIIGLRNENSSNQVVADAGSAYNNWITGGTMFTGKLTDNGTRNSFLDTFHRSFNALNGDWYGSQQDATLTNHYRLGTGTGNERGLLNRYQTDSGYRWTTGFSDATAGEQFYQVLDELNNVYRLSIGQYNQGQSSSNNQTVINAAGSGAVVLNGSNNAGTGGVVVGSGGASETTVATINNAGNAQFNGTLQVGGPSTFTASTTVRNQADAEVDAFLWAGATANQKESFIYKDYTGASQWYLVKDASNNWAVNSATGGLDSFKAYQSNNSGDTYINASNATGHIRLNYEAGAGAETDIYSGSSASLAAAFQGPTSIKLPGLAAGSGHNCLQIDNSGYITNTGAACGSSGGGTVNSASTGQIAYYTSNGAAIAGMSAVPLTAGGTGAQTAAGALANLLPGVGSDSASGITVSGTVAAAKTVSNVANVVNIASAPYRAVADSMIINSGLLTTSGSNKLGTLDTTTPFTAAMEGKTVVLLAAGPNYNSDPALPGKALVACAHYVNATELDLYASGIGGCNLASPVNASQTLGSGSGAIAGTDDTTAIKAAWSAAQSLNQPLYIPPAPSSSDVRVQYGFWFGGSALSGWANPQVQGDGPLVSTIILPPSIYFIDDASTLWQTVDFEGVQYFGGIGAFRNQVQSNYDVGHYIVRNNDFNAFIGTAISTGMKDNPYWDIFGNQFYAANTWSSIGLYLATSNDNSTVAHNHFINQRIGVASLNFSTIHSRENEFLQYLPESTPAGTYTRAGYWVAGNSANSWFQDEKFGNENKAAATDYPILIAQQSTGSSATDLTCNDPVAVTNGTTCSPGNRLPATGAIDIKVTGFHFNDSWVAGTGNVPQHFIYSYSWDLYNNTITNISNQGTVLGDLIHLDAAALAVWQDPTSTPANSIYGPMTYGNICGPVLLDSPSTYSTNYGGSPSWSTGGSNANGLCWQVDPIGQLQTTNLTQGNTPASNASNAGFTDSSPTNNNWAAADYTHNMVTTIADSAGGSNAVRLVVATGSTNPQFYISGSGPLYNGTGLTPYEPIWVSLDVQGDAAGGTALTQMQLSLVNRATCIVNGHTWAPGTLSVWTGVIAIPPVGNGWKRINMRTFVPQQATNCPGYLMVQGSAPYTAITAGSSMDVGLPHLYQAYDPVGGGVVADALNVVGPNPTIKFNGVTQAFSTIPVPWSVRCDVPSTASGLCFAPLTLATSEHLARFQLWAATTPTGCTTAPGYGLYDSTASSYVSTIPMANGTGVYDSGALNIALTSGHTYYLAVSRAGTSCTANAAGVSATFQFIP